MHFTNQAHDTHVRSRRSLLLAATSASVAIVVLSLCVNAVGSTSTAKAALEEIYILHSNRRVSGAQNRLSGGRSLSGSLSDRPDGNVGPVRRGASDDQHDDEQGRLRRRHESPRIHAGIDRDNPPVEGKVME
jgi:hypothetical protein